MCSLKTMPVQDSDLELQQKNKAIELVRKANQGGLEEVYQALEVSLGRERLERLVECDPDPRHRRS